MPPVIYHSGDLGDVIAAIPSIRALGGGSLIIGPGPSRESLKGARFDSIKPLLEAQPMITSVEWSETKDGCTHDLSIFRESGVVQGESLAHWQARYLGVEISLDPWLVVPKSPETQGRVIVANSGRYRHEAFPWTKLLRGKYRDALFVGTKQEHDAFRFRTSTRTTFFPTANLFELAKAIAGCRLFIGNQSCPFWIAAALGVPLIQEVWPTSPNSIIERPNAQYWWHEPEDFC